MRYEAQQTNYTQHGACLLVQGGFASDVGQQSLVAALASNMPALRQLVLLLEHCGKVQAAAAQQQGQQKDQVRLCGSLL